MRNVTLLLLFSLLTLSVAAQGVFSNQTNAALQKVIQDYPNHFSNIKGDRLSELAHGVHFTSRVQIPGNINCILTQNLTKKEAYSWKCELFQTSDFEKAKGKFSELFNQIHNTIIKVEGEKPSILNGKYEVPENSRKFTNIQFHFLPASGSIQKLKVDLTLQHEASGWKILLSVQEQEAQGDLATGS
jgi:hypothetical protein